MKFSPKQIEKNEFLDGSFYTKTNLIQGSRGARCRITGQSVNKVWITNVNIGREDNKEDR